MYQVSDSTVVQRIIKSQQHLYCMCHIIKRNENVKKNLPSYTNLIICDHIYQRYEDYHQVCNEMNKKIRIQTVDYIVFSENDRYVLNNAA